VVAQSDPTLLCDGDDITHLYYYVWVNEKQSRLICFYQPGRDFLVPQMKNVLKLLGNYAPNNLTKYQPDRILLVVAKGANAFTSESATSVPWPADLPHLETAAKRNRYLLTATEPDGPRWL
jgi:hypothetical protein